MREDTPPVELPKEVWEKLSREQEIHKEDLPSGITLDDVRKARESYYQKPSRLVLDALTDTKNRYAIILGDPGSGKSTLARYVMLSLIDPVLTGEKIQKAFEGYLPLLIELRAFVGACADGKCDTPLEFLEHLGKTEGWGLTQTALHNHLKNDGHAVVIFDGLDEIFEPKLRETITNQIVGFTNAYPKARVIVTSRILGYRRKILSDAGFTHFTMQDLDEKQVEDFITKWYQLAMRDRPDDAKERSERILNSFKNSASIRQLAGNPMLLTIMAIIGKHQELPRERWKLYDHAASVLIQHWDVNKHLKLENIEADFIGEDDKKELLRRLAYRMQSGDGGLAGNYIHREGLQEEFENYLKDRYSKAPDQAKIIAEAMIQQFRERNFILSLYGANLYGFVHRAFLEYFCASAFVWKFEKTKELPIEQLKTDVYGKHWEDPSWREVLRLICGMIDEKWAGEIITYLIKNTNLLWQKNLANSIPWNIALAVQCLSELRNLNIVADHADLVQSVLCSLFERETIDLLKIARKGANLIESHRSFLLEQILSSVDAIGSSWPSINRVKVWLEHLEPLEYAWFYANEIGRLIGNIAYGNSEIFTNLVKLSVNPNENYRVFTPFALVIGWHDEPQVLALLREQAVQDDDANVRRFAVTALVEHYGEDAQTLSLLREHVMVDNDSVVRSTAVSALAERYHDEVGTLPLLRECAVKDNDAGVRSAAVLSLAKHYREDAQTLPLLRKLAVQDGEGGVRSATISMLAEHYREDSQTLPLIRKCAMKDKDSEVRSTAVRALAEHYREDSQTLLLVRECAVKDKDSEARSTAVRVLAEYSQ